VSEITASGLCANSHAGATPIQPSCATRKVEDRVAPGLVRHGDRRVAVGVLVGHGDVGESAERVMAQQGIGGALERSLSRSP
jgi:hypothetical protein